MMSVCDHNWLMVGLCFNCGESNRGDLSSPCDIPGLRELDDDVVSNFDGIVNKGIAEELRKNPEKCFAGFPGWNFYCNVWFNGFQFCGKVVQYNIFKGFYFGESIEDLREEICFKFGWD